jgi:hypothetical protein
MDVFSEINPDCDLFSEFYQKLEPIIEFAKQEDKDELENVEEKKKVCVSIE